MGRKKAPPRWQEGRHEFDVVSPADKTKSGKEEHDGHADDQHGAGHDHERDGKAVLFTHGYASPLLHHIGHSFASRALALGESLSMIGKLLGHNKIDTTARYAHPAHDSIKASSAKVADSIGADIFDESERDEAAVPA